MASSGVPPRPAATIILLRHGARHAQVGLEVLMVRRSPSARFMPGVWVFPGGAVERAERGEPQADVAQHAGAASPRPATDRDRGPPAGEHAEPITADEVAAQRRLEGRADEAALERAHRSCAVRELAEEAGIELPEDRVLLPWSRWVTPVEVPVRFDTRFYVALAPPHASPRPDGNETVEARWLSPARALDLHRAGKLSLVFPTIKHLESLLPFPSADEVIAAARRHRVEAVLPKLVGEGESRRVVLPGEPGYD